MIAREFINITKLIRQTMPKYIFLTVIALALYVYTASSMRQIPHISSAFVPKSQSVSSVAKTVSRTVNHGQKPLTYNFTDYPDGPIPAKDWNFEVGAQNANYNNEAETYTSSQQNARIQNGLLIIEAKHQKLNGKQYTSARINTRGVFDFTYGTLEVDMMMPRGVGTWPAAWLMPSNGIYNTGDFGIAAKDKYAWALNGEIDFAEAIGSLPGQNIPAAHSYHEIQTTPTYTPAYIINPYSVFHRYGIIKTQDKIAFTIDGVTYSTRSKTSGSPLDWPYNQPYYLILNLAIGGNWAGANGIDSSSAPWLLKIKSISYSPL